MALIDVSDLLLDPDFVNAITLIHRSPTVNTYGENVLTESSIQTIGSVQPASGKVIQRLPDSLRVANIYSFWIKAGIVADSSTAYPDIIVFNGKRFQVQTVMDWSNFGAGWNEGIAIAEVLS